MAVLSVQRWSSRQHAELHLFTEMFHLIFQVSQGISAFPSSFLDFNWLKGNCDSEMKDKVTACLSHSKCEEVWMWSLIIENYLFILPKITVATTTASKKFCLHRGIYVTEWRSFHELGTWEKVFLSRYIKAKSRCTHLTFLCGHFCLCLSRLIPSLSLLLESFTPSGFLPLSQRGFAMLCSESLDSDFLSPWHISPPQQNLRLDLGRLPPLLVSPKIWSCHKSFSKRAEFARVSTCPPDLLGVAGGDWACYSS